MTRDHDEPFARHLLANTDPWGLRITPEQTALMQAHFRLLLETNRHTNLTSITDPTDAAVKHYADSLALLAWSAGVDTDGWSVLDIGTGAGLPAVALAVMRRDWRITAIEATRKKVEFVQRAVDELGIANLRVEHAHSREWATQDRFDVVVARAVSKLAPFLRTAARFVSEHGWLVSYKAQPLDENEHKDAQRAARAMKLVARDGFDYCLRLEDELIRRRLYVFGRRP